MNDIQKNEGTIAMLTPQLNLLNSAPLLHMTEKMIEIYNPLQICLFGSRARQTAREDSDWDFGVVVSNDAQDEILDPMFSWAVRRDFAMFYKVYVHISVFKKNEFDEDFDVVNTLPHEIARDGLLIYSMSIYEH